jgi:hypothetical protein
MAREMSEGTGYQSSQGIGIEQGALQFQAAGMGYVVAIHPGYQFRPTRCEPGIQGNNQTLSGHRNNLDPAVSARGIRQNVWSGVTRTIVNCDQLPRCHGLAKQGVESGWEKLLLVANWK